LRERVRVRGLLRIKMLWCFVVRTTTTKTISVSGLPRGYKEPLAMTDYDNGNDKKENDIEGFCASSQNDIVTTTTTAKRKKALRDSARARRMTNQDIRVSGLPRGYKAPLAMTTLLRRQQRQKGKRKFKYPVSFAATPF
jgi:hypothetical protein